MGQHLPLAVVPPGQGDGLGCYDLPRHNSVYLLGGMLSPLLRAVSNRMVQGNQRGLERGCQGQEVYLKASDEAEPAHPTPLGTSLLKPCLSSSRSPVFILSRQMEASHLPKPQRLQECSLEW